MPTINEYEVQVQVEDAKAIYVGPEAIVALQADANRQADEWLTEVNAMWDDLDVTSLEQLKNLEYKLSRVSAAISALKFLAPVPDEDED